MTRGKQAVQKRDVAASLDPEQDEVEAKAGSDNPPDGSDGPPRGAESGTRPPRSSFSPGRLEPSGDLLVDYLDVYRLSFPKRLINNIDGIQMGMHVVINYGSGGIVTKMWLDLKTSITFIRLSANKDPDSEYRQTIGLLPDGTLASFDPHGATYGAFGR